MQDFQPQVIFGLGNVGKNYIRTRHNAGFLFLDYLYEQHKAEYQGWREERKWQATVCQPFPGSDQPVLVKPTTMMNLSGTTVESYTHYFHIPIDKILIAHDDLDLALGSFKLHFAKGPKVHNGLKSIDEKLASVGYWRLRLGIENREPRGNKLIAGMNYTLDNFAPSELELLETAFSQAESALN